MSDDGRRSSSAERPLNASARKKGKQRAVSDEPTPRPPTPSRKRSASEDDRSPSKRFRAATIELEDVEEFDDELFEGIPDDVDATALRAAMNEAIELSDTTDDEDEPVVIRPPIASVSEQPVAVAPIPAKSEDGPQPFSQLVCPICLGPPCPLVITICGHAHCGPCLHSAMTAEKGEVGMLKGNCPVCRTELVGGWGKSVRGISWKVGPLPS